MTCDPVKITLKDGAISYCIPMPRKILFPLLRKIEKKLIRLGKEGTIQKDTEPTSSEFSNCTCV